MSKIILLILCTFMFVLFSLPALANKTSVRITAPEKVKKDTTITITINVTHKGNSIFHFTDWVYLKVNGKEVKRWEYGMFSRPSNENFILVYELKITDNTTIEAMGDCNLHGSSGKVSFFITVEQ